MTELFFIAPVTEGSSTNNHIPFAWVEKYFKDVHSIEAVLHVEGSNGMFWGVRAQKLGNEFHFTSGWDNFLFDNDIQSGESVRFRYKEDGDYVVSIFDCNGLPRRRFITENNSESDDVGGGGSNDWTDAIPQGLVHNVLNMGEGIEVRGVEEEDDFVYIDDPILGRPTRKCYIAYSDALEYANEWVRRCPCFVASMTTSYVRAGEVHLPVRFSCKFMTPTHEVATLTESMHRRSTLVRVSPYNSNGLLYYKFTDGFGHFLGENNIRPRDVCVFIANDPCLSFVVRIFRRQR